ncbi:MAG TPA: L-threonylcarbamoyladenylate synthase [Spirochaetota bacterium]|jgi:tRNA threonylcarbamoyl adenosine modification protein (Sua5/YciO/YrdC/YwlC family)|nr:threonylcarbamoyl-AMP synthase [Spirochaetota bacterium]OQA97846.1 MAG: Threonylcarbamoyl-AMP synthase [Spirochaetes bacterium ADurb.Bin218]HOK01262.1 L-threonylcarbamoyladenylate synthase [Spirochaetota bacterium]HOK92890.1 L-threonylcarbamoyladenylate synthase [Spirochaetota bacterium]HON16346.1 L-threonylcarbamoyladenylate synthase [Spirochaetota bacterium]
MIFVINEKNPQQRLIQKVKECLEDGGIIVFPTDTVYAYGCDIKDKRAIERIYRLKKLDKRKPLSFIFTDISEIADYVRNVSDDAFKIMKKAFPGPYTFIFKASKLVPKIVMTNQKTIGVRIPDNNIALDIVRALGRPILATSVFTLSGEYLIDPRELEKVYRNEVDIVIDAGPKIAEPSTVVDFSEDSIEIIREGKGKIFF